MKQESLALDAGTDSGYLSRIENGERQPSLEMLERIALALNTTIAALFARAEGLGAAVPRPDLAEPTLGPDTSRQCLHYFRSLTPANQRLAVELMKTLHRLQAQE